MKNNEQFLCTNLTLEKQQELLVSMMNDDRYKVEASAVFCDMRTGKMYYNNLEQRKITFEEDEGGTYILFWYDSIDALYNSVKRTFNRQLEHFFVGVEILIIDKESKDNEYVMKGTYLGGDGMRMGSSVTLKMYNSMVFATKNK